MINEITVQELKKMQDEKKNFLILDVREPSEYEKSNLGGHLIPLRELPQRMDELNPNQLIIVHCAMGGRSSKAVEYLQAHGFTKIFNLKGGIEAWTQEIGPALTSN